MVFHLRRHTLVGTVEQLKSLSLILWKEKQNKSSPNIFIWFRSVWYGDSWVQSSLPPSSTSFHQCSICACAETVTDVWRSSVHTVYSPSVCYSSLSVFIKESSTSSLLFIIRRRPFLPRWRQNSTSLPDRRYFLDVANVSTRNVIDNGKHRGLSFCYT